MPTNTNDPDSTDGSTNDAHLDVDAAQDEAESTPVKDDRTPPAADEDRNP